MSRTGTVEVLATFPVLVTERLVLREIVAADAADLFAFRSDPEEQKHNDPAMTSSDEAAALVERLATEYRDGAVRWGLTRAGEDVVVGLLGYNCWHVQDRSAGVGYDLSRRLWGRGLMAEAMRAVLEFGDGPMNLHRIEAHTNAENAASVRMLRRLGFWREGTFHDRFFEDGAFHDVALFVRLGAERPGVARSDQPRNTPVTQRS